VITETLPSPVIDLITDLISRPIRVDALGGMSGARVMRVTGLTGSIIAKAKVSAQELAVYRSLSSVFSEAGIRIPKPQGFVDAGGETWLLLEDIQRSLPSGRWLADAEVLGTLHRLHRLAPATLDLLPDQFQPEWTGAMVQAAMRWLGDDTDIAGRLAALRVEAAPLFEPHGVISGDPNPLNLGLSRSGKLVLMDWERIGLGHPAIDLAITIAGLPTTNEFEQTAAAYCAAGMGRNAAAVQVEPRHLVLAKLWTLTEFLAETPPLGEGGLLSESNRRRQEIAEVIAGKVPTWVRRVT